MGERQALLRRAVPAALLALALAAGTSAAQTPSLGAYHALVIGNQAYRQLPQLATPVADARAVADLLRRDYGFAGVRVLENATRAQMVVWLDDRKIGETETGTALVMSNLPVGTYRLKARKAGKEWEREVQVAANQRAEVQIDIDPLGPARVFRGDDGVEMVLVPAGEFWMGSEDYDEEKPRHRLYLDAFYIDRYVVTNALYQRFMRATGHQAPRYWNDSEWNGPLHPVVGVTWYDAVAYCHWAGKRLPTEAEWEKAARGTDGRKYPWGNLWDPSRANSRESKLGKTTWVGSYPGGASPYGALDMAGNVWQWVADWYDAGYYKRSPERNPRGPESGLSRVLRGASWVDLPIHLRTSGRGSSTPDSRDSIIGFRCARRIP